MAEEEADFRVAEAVGPVAAASAAGHRQGTEGVVLPVTGRRLAVAFHPAQAGRVVQAVHRRSLEAKVRQARPPVRQGQRSATRTGPTPGPRDSKKGPSGKASVKKVQPRERIPVSKVPPNGPTHANSKPPTGPAVVSRPRSLIMGVPIQKQAIRLRQAVIRHALSTLCRPLATTITTTGMVAKSRRWPSARPWWVLS